MDKSSQARQALTALIASSALIYVVAYLWVF